ncbi:MAG: flippase-like domain-containing protein [Marinicaulis sp.]|nr:flippase-like domain-containing protein [Marinicaulis sp.]
MADRTDNTFPNEEEFENRLKKSRRLIMLAVALFIALIGIGFASLNLESLQALGEQIRTAQPRWLAASALSQLMTYACTALIWRRALVSAGYSLPFRDLYWLSVGKLFADQAIPSAGLSGGALFFYAFAKRNIPNKIAFSLFIFVCVAYFIAFFIAGIISFAALTAVDSASPVISTSITTVAIVLMSILVISFLIIISLPNATPRWAQKVPHFNQARHWVSTALYFIKTERRLFFELTALQFFVRLIDGITLYLAFVAINISVPIEVCFFTVIIGSIASMVGFMPMGVGAYEAGMIATLKVFGVPIDSAIAATVIFRGLTLWLPLIPGFYIVQREIFRKKASAG